MTMIGEYFNDSGQAARVLRNFLVGEGFLQVERMPLIDAAKLVTSLATTRKSIIEIQEHEATELHAELDEALGLGDYDDFLDTTDEGGRPWEAYDLGDDETAVEINQVINTLYLYLEEQGNEEPDDLTWSEAAAEVVALARKWEAVARENFATIGRLWGIIE